MARETIRAVADREDGSTRVLLLELEIGHDDYWSVFDIVEGDDMSVLVRTLDDKHRLSDYRVEVREADGSWSEPDCLTLAEALEASI